MPSDVPQLTIAAQAMLPQAPPTTPDHRDCRPYTVPPASEAGRIVAAHGWAITGDLPLGQFQAVSYAGGMVAGTSGGCFIDHGAIAIFLGSRIVALVRDGQFARDEIGQIRAVEGNAIRIWRVAMDQVPIADLRADMQGALRLGPLAASERLCDGRAMVPNVYGIPIDQARRVLQRSGWTPIPQPMPGTDPPDDRIVAFHRAGVNELEDCAGSGFAFCSFKYQGRAGSLSVVTSGEERWPSVAAYSVQCQH